MAARESGVELVSLCGGIGACDSCKVQLISGLLSDHTIEEEATFYEEELEDGWRLACQAELLEDARIFVPPESLTSVQRLQLEGESFDIEIDPPVTVVDVQVAPATINDLRPDTLRLVETIRKMGLPSLAVSYPVLAELPVRLREQEWSARLAINAEYELISVLPRGALALGLAVDIGTTSIAAYLVDLSSGQTLAKKGEMNPQIAYGEDVVNRIFYTNEHSEGGLLLQKLVVDIINRLAGELCEKAGQNTGQIVDVVAVGNTAMHHLFTGLPVRQLGEAPYVPVTGDELKINAREIGLNSASGALVYLPPIIAGYVGADHTAMLLATDVWQTSRTFIAIDIGTNTEVTLGHQGRLLCCSCASGPAFEGAHIGAGMRAAPGAIERVQMLDGDLKIQTIGGKAAVGLCGSGIVDALAVMVESGVINHRGAIQNTHGLGNQPNDGRPSFVLVPAADSGSGRDIAVSRKDVAEIQLAKGAIRAGIEILISEADITVDEVEEFIIAGAFGSYINVASAKRIGMFPDLPKDSFRQVGNAAGMGALQLLISKDRRRDAAKIARQLEYVELTTHSSFQDEFMRNLNF